MNGRNLSEQLNDHLAGRLRASQAAWQELSPEILRQKDAAEALLQRLRENPQPATAPLVRQLEDLVAQLQAAALRIVHHLPLAEQSAGRIDMLQTVVNRQNLLREWEDLLDVHPQVLSAEAMLRLLEEVWERLILGRERGRLGPLGDWDAAMLAHLDRSLLASRRVSALLLAGCSNPFLVPNLWRKARVAVCEPDRVICHWMQALVSRHLLLGEGGAVGIEARAVDFMDALRLEPRAFDLIWFGLESWESWCKASRVELLTALGQLSARVEFLALTVPPDLAPQGRNLLADAGYATEDEWRSDNPAEPVTLLVRNPVTSASGAFFLESQAVVCDPMIEALADEPARLRPRPVLPPPRASVSVTAAPSVRDPATLSLRTRLACCQDRVLVSFHSPVRNGEDELRAAQHLSQCLRDLEGIAPQIPRVETLPTAGPNPVVLACGGPAVLLSGLPPAGLDWGTVWNEVWHLIASLRDRAWFLRGLRPGWFVRTPDGLRLCGLEDVTREETEDTLSALWWFFHDLPAPGRRWRSGPVPPPRTVDRPDLPPDLCRKLDVVRECETLDDALTIFRTP